MKQYLYVFSYRSPKQWLIKQHHDEQFCAFFIEAISKQQALNWGQHVAETLVSQLFASTHQFKDIPIWKATDFANWIEDHPLSRFSGLALEMFPVVKIGEIPEIHLI